MRCLRVSRVLLDVGVLSLALIIAYQFRFDWDMSWSRTRQMVVLLPWLVGLQYLCLYAFRVPNFSWRYIGLREVRPIVLASLTAALMALAVRFLAPLFVESMPLLRHVVVPVGVITTNAVLMMVGIGGVRMVRRMHTERRATKGNSENAEPTIIIGAGVAGLGLAKELAKRPDLGLRAVGFADDDPVNFGAVIHGLKVLGSTDKLVDIARRSGATQALIAVARIRGEQVARIVKLCTEAGLKAKIIPPYDEIVTGRVSWTQIREVAIEDLLGREPVVLDGLEPSRLVKGKTVMVTGAGGSIGSELCRQILHSRPETLVLVEQAENSLFNIHRELAPLVGAITLVPAIADVCDAERMRQLFTQYRPEVVLHAAAHKHVPMMEANPREAIKNNALGTAGVADLASEFGAECFLLISTDKAVNPTSVMGCTKRVAEMYLRAIQPTSKTRFVSVRFGNVLGSAGSVIPIFKEQIARGGPVTVTHPDMVRYFMTIPEACQLVLEAASIAEGGQVMVLDMGEPVRIKDLAEQMIRLSGFEPGVDMQLVFSGVRPGEKLFEELAFADESMVPTASPRIFLRCCTTAEKDSPDAIRSHLREALPEGASPRAVLGSLVASYRPGESHRAGETGAAS
jgi:FlaA1/EpsC-like NDP-sugar epimerase